MSKEIARKDSLFNIETGLVALFDEVATLQAEGQEPSQELWQQLDEQMEKSQEKRDNVARFLLFIQSQKNLLSEEMSLLGNRLLQISKAEDALKAHILSTIERTGLKELEGNTHTLKARKNPVKVEVLDELSLPPEFISQYQPPVQLKPDKTAIKKAIEAGQDVPGAQLITTYKLEVK